MPTIRHYVVTQTREVKVTANNMRDAITIASAAFENGQTGDNKVRGRGSIIALDNMFGDTSGPIAETALNVREEM